ncbi:citrate synthase [Methanohalophilus levihalophilus]|uniref:citrate/2-methylcitrate synthase n=1 Tax=Methanohalophilus levihalophilus TaxID=1431282 RepID=UPI001FD9D219|nr:citrate/2-methylcitrate synthase [Methanohalophilus levihalophilus]MBP2029100.1 citrate synthase [Methanohalophilus levihalophilus]
MEGNMPRGLENIIALESEITFIDGEQGILKYRGHDVQSLSSHSYDEVSYLLINGRLPDKFELDSYSKKLKQERVIGDDAIAILKFCNFNIEAMDALRTAVSYMSHCDPELNDNSAEANVNKGIRMIAKFPTMVAVFSRQRRGLDVIQPDLSLSHGANFLYMLKGSKPTDLESRVLESDFILSADHELNPSAFTARTIASTLSDIYSSVIGGLCALKGPLHGGARMAVMEMIDEIGSPENAERYVMDKVSNKQKLMGFGHRVYKTYDPRARVYKQLAREIAIESGNMLWFDIAEKIEEIAYREFVENKGKPIYPNVDFYSAVVYKYLDIPPKLATAVFAIGRSSGWIAHCLEQYSDNRLIRPRAKYVGPDLD